MDEKPTVQIKQNKNTFLIVVLVFVLGAVVAALGYTVYLLKNPSNVPSGEATPLSLLNTVATPEEPTEPNNTQPVPSLSNKVFYSDSKGNILSYDYSSKETKSWNSVTGSGDSSALTSIYSLKIIDNNTLGFGRCDVVKGNFNCGIYTLDLLTNTVNLQKKLPPEKYLHNVAFTSKDTFAYTADNSKTWEFVYNKKGVETILDSFNVNPFGRGGSIEDSSKIMFSPDNSKVFYIETSSPRSSTDFNVYGFMIGTSDKFVIKDATQPDWLSNNEIIYRAIKTNIGFNIYNLNSKTSSKITVASENSYNPYVGDSNKYVVYEVNPAKEVHLYNIANKTDTLLISQAVSPLWISPSVIVYGAAAPCPVGGCEIGPMGEVFDITVTVYNVESKKVLATVPSSSSTYNIASY